MENHTMRTRLVIVAIAALTFFTAYLLGAFSYSRNLWPIELLRQIKDSKNVQAKDYADSLNQYDSVARLTFHPYKQRVECPVQTQSTAVLLVMGQSNAANLGQKKFTTRYPNHVVNYSQGSCYVASSPLLGGSGQFGEYITPLADQLIAKGTYKDVVLIVVATGSPISRWQRDGDINEVLIDLIKKAQTQYHITGVIWHQGSTDAQWKTTTKLYLATFRSLRDTLTELKVTAPIFIAIESRWCQASSWTPDNPVAIAQSQLIDNRTIFLGADTDRLVELKDRYDTCHLNETGQIKIAEALAESISALKDRVTSKGRGKLVPKHQYAM